MFRFNDELLLSEADRALAEKRFPDIFFALDHPALRADFMRVNKRANKAKSRSRMIGLLALSFAILSLMTFPLEPLIRAIFQTSNEAVSVFRGIAIVGAAFGLLAVLVGNFGLWFGKNKRDWLQKRLMTERMRQWHAQYLIAHLVDITHSAKDETAKAEFLAKREASYARFERSFLGQISSEYTKYTLRTSAAHVGQTTIDPKARATFWIEPNWAAAATRKLPPEHKAAADQVFEAYEETRLLGQIQYTNYILSSEGKFWSLPAKQAHVLGNTAFAFVLFAFAANFVALIGAIWPPFPIGWQAMASVAIVFAIAAVGVRAMEEGLRPQRELRRMEFYAASVDHSRAEFARARTPGKKIEAMCLLERASFEEMLEFLGTNDRARFVL